MSSKLYKALADLIECVDAKNNGDYSGNIPLAESKEALSASYYERTNKHTYFMQLAMRASAQGHCLRRQVGAVIVDANNNIKALTYNGPARGRPHCDDGHACHGVTLAPGQDRCEGLHAEQSAVLAAGNTPDLAAIYVTEAPCFACAKFLLHTSIHTIYIPEHSDRQEHSKALWQSAGKSWVLLDDYPHY